MAASRLTGKVVLVTGASSGIGAETARQLAAKGAIVVLTARSEERLGRVAAGLPGEHDAVALDVRDEASVRCAVARTIERYGRIDVLINNAGYGEFIPFEEASLAHFAEMMDVNYMGAVRCIRETLPYMRRAGHGHIVNVASIAGKLATAKASGYAATKHALLGLTNGLRQELKGTGIAVSAINPGPIDTPFFERADPDGTYVRNVRWFLLRPEKVASAIVKVLETRRPELDLPWTAAVGVRFAQLLPRLTDRLFSGMMNRK